MKPKIRRYAVCECGKRKRLRAEACQRCLDLGDWNMHNQRDFCGVPRSEERAHVGGLSRLEAYEFNRACDKWLADKVAAQERVKNITKTETTP